jgi:AcrR family transcriptional regulator
MKVCNADIKERVIRTTSGLLKKNGLRGWNMDILARETGIAKNTLYKIVGSKERLFEQVILSKMEEDLLQVRHIINDEKDYARAVDRITGKFVDLTKDNIDYVFPSIYREYPGLEKKVRTSQKQITSFIIDFIRKGMDQGLIRDDVAPEFVLDLIEGIALHYFRTGVSGTKFEKAFQSAMDCLANGLRKQGKEAQ